MGSFDQFNRRSAGVWRVRLQSGVGRKSFRSLLTSLAYIHVGEAIVPGECANIATVRARPCPKGHAADPTAIVALP
ncbi:MAG TPA: hypothetical protein EYQ30_08655 [Gammaproteobacteria bacterium]|nr:hypothetical protein [Gammaproteobacteria bacterium]HIL62827.1 hypothetical protein [Porticoccaceae bacterium]